MLSFIPLEDCKKLSTPVALSIWQPSTSLRHWIPSVENFTERTCFDWLWRQGRANEQEIFQSRSTEGHIEKNSSERCCHGDLFGQSFASSGCRRRLLQDEDHSGSRPHSFPGLY